VVALYQMLPSVLASEVFHPLIHTNLMSCTPKYTGFTKFMCVISYPYRKLLCSSEKVILNSHSYYFMG